MSPQENINNLLSKMSEALQIVKECEVLVLEEIKQIAQLQEEKGRLAGQVAALSKELSLIQKNIEKTRTSKTQEIIDKEEDVAIITAPIPEAVAPTLVAEKHSIETLADKFHGQPSLNDKIAAKSDITTTGARVNDLAKAISINDRLLFIKELFGNGEIFTQTIRQLNGLQSFDEAQQYLAATFPRWDYEGSAAQLFLSTIHRRYL